MHIEILTTQPEDLNRRDIERIRQWFRGRHRLDIDKGQSNITEPLEDDTQ